MKKYIILIMFLLPLISLAQPSPCETYTSGNYDYPSCSGNTSTCSTSYSGTATVIYSSPGSISIVPGTGFSAGTFSGNGYFKVLASSLNGGTATETNVSCYGGSNGTATANPSAGYTPYTYLWSNSKTTQIISGLTAATYTCTITDGQGQNSFRISYGYSAGKWRNCIFNTRPYFCLSWWFRWHGYSNSKRMLYSMYL